jgi:hypothetical protein
MNSLQKLLQVHAQVHAAAVQVSTEQLQPVVRRKLLQEFRSSHYSTANVHDYLLSTKYCTKVSSNDQKITINCVHPDETLPIGVHIAVLKRVVMRVQTLSKIYPMANPIIFWLVPVDDIKTFPKPGKIIDVSHVNSAYTYINGDTVYIYRREEFPKVILHETLHHIAAIDTSKEWTQEQLKFVFDMFKIHENTLLRPNEAIVETWADLMQIAFVSIEYKMDFQKLYDTELNWSLQQAKRILAKQGNSQWREGTHAYSYYVLRSLFMFDIEAFLKAHETADASSAKVGELVRLVRNTFASKEYSLRLRGTRLPKHDSFRMTVFGDL